jgi:hypothetical protein
MIGCEEDCDTDEEVVAIDTLVHDLLGVEAAELAAMARTNDMLNSATLYGLQAYLRHILELAIHVRDRHELTLHLKDEATAKAHGFPNARLANLATILVSAIIRDERYVKKLPFAAIEPARGLEFDPVIEVEQSLTEMPLDELFATFKKFPEMSLFGCDEALLAPTFPVTVSEFLRSEFCLEPALLTRGHAATEARPKPSSPADPKFAHLPACARSSGAP